MENKITHIVRQADCKDGNKNHKCMGVWVEQTEPIQRNVLKQILCVT